MTKLTTLAFTVLLLGSQALQAQVIIPAESRSGLIGGMQDTLANVDRTGADFTGLPSPFNPPDEEAKAVASDTTEKPAPRISFSSSRLKDEDALRVISSQFNPIGSLVVGTRGVLQLESGKTIEQGSSFPAKIRGHEYIVIITEVTSKGYTLKLGDAQVQRNFIEAGATD